MSGYKVNFSIGASPVTDFENVIVNTARFFRMNIKYGTNQYGEVLELGDKVFYYYPTEQVIYSAKLGDETVGLAARQFEAILIGNGLQYLDETTLTDSDRLGTSKLVHLHALISSNPETVSSVFRNVTAYDSSKDGRTKPLQRRGRYGQD